MSTASAGPMRGASASSALEQVAAPLLERRGPQVGVAIGQAVEGHELGGRLAREHRDPGCGRMDPQQERVEVEARRHVR